MEELEVVSGIRAMLGPHKIRDDCAELKNSGRKLLATTDMLIDRIHFNSETTSLDLIGRKAVCVNLSDLAASGAKPTELLVSLAIPQTWSSARAIALMRAMNETAKFYDVSIVGGDTNQTLGPLVINVTALGESHWRGPVLRSGAKAFDTLMITGRLGGSLQSGRHLRFEPRVQESQWLLDHFQVHAMMDLSDGLASDLRHILKASNLAADLFAESIPICNDCVGSSEARLKQAFCDGEDFELLFTVNEDTAQKISQVFPWPCGVSVIGKLKAGEPKIWLAPSMREVTWTGYEHR